MGKSVVSKRTTMKQATICLVLVLALLSSGSLVEARRAKEWQKRMQRRIENFNKKVEELGDDPEPEPEFDTDGNPLDILGDKFEPVSQPEFDADGPGGALRSIGKPS